MNKERPCKNCQQFPREHRYTPEQNLACDVDRLPLQLQEIYYNSSKRDTLLKTYVVYNAMDNLQYLEYQYEKERNDTPTRTSLQ